MNWVVCRQDPRDKYYTPIELVKQHITMTPIQPEDTLLDPFLGGGIYYDNYPTHNKKDWCEIEKGRDFFQYEKNVDWIISNPPFSKLNLVLDKCASICNKGFSLIIVVASLTIPRILRMMDKGFVISRLGFFEVRSWHGFMCAVVVFERGTKSLINVMGSFGKTKRIPRLTS